MIYLLNFVFAVFSVFAEPPANSSRVMYGPGAGRAMTYQNHFFPSENAQSYLNAPTETKIEGTRRLMTVLPGVLYRGGSGGGQSPLTKETLQRLCEAGFSLAVYAYETNFIDYGPIDCVDAISGQKNTIEYLAGEASTEAFKLKFLSKVREVILDENRGPIFEHCWNGMHASGELAAVALRQFCETSAADANAYWLKHAGGYKLISRIGRFSPHAELTIPTEAQKNICPDPIN